MPLDPDLLIAAGHDSGDALAMDLSLALSNALADVNSRDAEIADLERDLRIARAQPQPVLDLQAEVARLRGALKHAELAAERMKEFAADAAAGAVEWEAKYRELAEPAAASFSRHRHVEPMSAVKIWTEAMAGDFDAQLSEIDRLISGGDPDDLHHFAQEAM